jgi:hypothetical protein
MGPQSRFMSLVESWTNILVGIGLQTAANAIFIPLLFVGATMEAKPLFWLVVIMTVLSQVRSYGLRRIFEAIRTRRTPPDFQYIVEEFATERWGQIEGEGFSLAHDDQHCNGELAMAAATYAYIAGLTITDRAEIMAAMRQQASIDAIHPKAVSAFGIWPNVWALSWLKPTHRRRDLVKAGAMLIAEIGRLDRLARRTAQ